LTVGSCASEKANEIYGCKKPIVAATWYSSRVKQQRPRSKDQQRYGHCNGQCWCHFHLPIEERQMERWQKKGKELTPRWGFSRPIQWEQFIAETTLRRSSVLPGASGIGTALFERLDYSRASDGVSLAMSAARRQSGWRFGALIGQNLETIFRASSLARLGVAIGTSDR
jgi:hypothetical protein